MKKSASVLLIFFLIMAAAPAWGGLIQLPQTGQTKCYDSWGAEISCAGTGQDGEIQAGIQWPNPRFVVNGDCVTDKLTGLMWAKNGNLPNATMTWYQALDYVASLNSDTGLCGYTDWRLPNVNELESIVNEGEVDTSAWLDTQGFTNVQSWDYWSSSNAANYAWTVNMGNGFELTSYKTYSYYCCFDNVWPVRTSKTVSTVSLPKTGQTQCYDSTGSEISCAGTGQDGDSQAGVAWPVSRFTDNGDQTVTDNLTGLIWTKDANAPGPATCNPGTYKTWQLALDYVECLDANSYLGYTDWRLPNRKELLSLIDFSQNNPALPSGYPFTDVQESTYWSSTTYATYPSYAWQVDMRYGGTQNDGKYGLYGDAYVWPVRGGQIGSQSCTYTYSDWGACQTDGTQTRTVSSSSPAGCVGTPDLSQSCVYVPPVPKLQISPSSYNFGSLAVDQCSSVPQPFTISNTGSAYLNISNITLSNANASDTSNYVLVDTGIPSCVGNLPLSYIAPGTSCTFGVAFCPTSIGAHDAYLTISSNDPTASGYIPITGTGITYTLQVEIKADSGNGPVSNPGSGSAVSSDGSISCGNSCQGSYDYGASVQLTANANSGWKFNHWESGTTSYTTNPLTITMEGDTTLTAVFLPGGCQTNVTGLSQTNPLWASDLYDHSATYTIKQKGCALTSLSMALNSAGITTIPGGNPNDPGWLNKFMVTDTCYDCYDGLNVNWDNVTRYISTSTMKFHFSRINSINDWQDATQYLDNTLCKEGHPVIVGVNMDQNGTPTHFVLVTGKRGNDYTIVDPFFSDRTTLSQYNNQFVTRGFVADPSGDISELNLAVGDAAEILVINSSGQETGYDPYADQEFQQIPNSVYFRDGLQDDITGAPPTEISHFAYIFQPSQGVYRIKVNGRKLGAYSLSIAIFSKDGSPQPGITITGIAGPGSSSSFSIQVNTAPGATTTVIPVATFLSTMEDISNSLSLGLIDNQGNANSLSKKIQAAQNADQPARANILKAFIEEVNALADKHIMGAAVPVLLRDANSLLTK